jgi:hypothetical protein
MFTIEFVIIHGRSRPTVVEKITSASPFLKVTNESAKSLFDGVCRRHLKTPPEAYLIKDNEGVIVFRSWEH